MLRVAQEEVVKIVVVVVVVVLVMGWGVGFGILEELRFLVVLVKVLFWEVD